MKTKLLSALLFAVIVTGMSAQNSQVLYFMNLPQNHLLNPALKPTNRLYIGFPGLTGVNLNISNNFINFSDFFSEGQEVSESTIPFLKPGFDAQGFLNKVKRINYIEPQVSLQVIGVGFTTGKDLYLFFDVTERAEANLVFPRDLVRLAVAGNEGLAGQTFDLSALKADAKYYREIGFGFSKVVAPRLRIGARGKLLFGIAAGSYRNQALNLTVNNDYTNRLIADISLSVSGPVNFYFNPDNKIDDVKFDDNRFDSQGGVRRFFGSMKNAGLGLDLGAEYTLTDRIILSASVTDLGFIRWRSDISNLKGHGDTELSGIDFADVRNGTATFADLTGNMGDSLRNAITFSETKDPFTTFVPFGITIGGKYNVTDFFSVGLLSNTRNVDRHLKEALTLSANLNLGNVLSTSLTYTASNRSYNNIGAGLGVRAGFSQIYFLVERIPVNWSSVSTGDGSAHLPANWHTVQGRFGINFVFGNKEVKKLEKPESSGE